jgi:hypothetical protein
VKQSYVPPVEAVVSGVGKYMFSEVTNKKGKTHPE